MAYLLLQYGEPAIRFSITKDDLLAVKKGWVDLLVDIDDRTYFDAEANEWKPIEVKS